MKITDFSRDVYSQFGEDGIIEHLFEKIGIEGGYCVEFGAGDGTTLSNTANLWQGGWSACLIEADEALATQMYAAAGTYEVSMWCEKITPQGSVTIDKILGGKKVDFMSIDIDGDDYWVLNYMETRPRAFCIEFNQSIPPHLSVVQPMGDKFGSSALAIKLLAEDKGYKFLGRTETNLFFVNSKDFNIHFANKYNTDFMSFFNYEDYTYLVTDYHGNSIGMGADPPWGIQDVYLGYIDTDYRMPLAMLPVRSFEMIFKTIQKQFPTAILLTPDNWANLDPPAPIIPMLESILRKQEPCICLSIEHMDKMFDYTWLTDLARHHQYSYYRYGDEMISLMLTLPRAGNL